MNTVSVDFSALETLEGFRSDFLYFVRLSGVYIQSIFWDVFSAKTGRRKEMIELAKEKVTDQHLLEAICNPAIRNLDNMDCLSGAFHKFLEAFPSEKGVNSGRLGMRDVFRAKLRENHAFFLNFDDFLAVVQRPLNQKRNFLEHWKDDETQKSIKKGKRSRDDAKTIEALGLLLPGSFLNEFLGRVTYWQGRVPSPAEQKNIEAMKAQMKERFTALQKERRVSTHILFSQELTRQKIDKSKRKSLVSEGSEWRIAFKELCYSRKDDYRLHEFKQRYYFIGKQNISRIRKLLDPAGKGSLVFKRDIEAFYLLTCRVNLHLHRHFHLLPMEERKKTGSSGKAWFIKGITDDETAKLTAIRDGVSHNHMFWAMHDGQGQIISVAEIFGSLMTVILRDHGKEKLNLFYSGLRHLFARQDFAYIDRRADHTRQPEKVRNWPEEKRQEYAKPEYEVDMRRLVRKQVGRWMRALRLAHQEVLKRPSGVSLGENLS